MAVVALAACSPAQTPTAPSQSMTGMSMPTTTQSTADAAVATNTVAIKNFAFDPAVITVKAGTTVTWTNSDQDPHTVTSDGKAGPLNSKPLNQGDTYQYTFTVPGTFSYLCTIHPFMTATVTVTP
ncbi:plastocyanin/azurin family copper-binding protein [Kutzneria buriramensis]|uniref:Plastocyanin n=1 Tax=Kutzneria buriramensis TaxID=1045776 RepID=A0A3E0HG23_9PSEU|nr:plastocyanin/azurin family copper-binding protein [Kutzneria buriramensis]REH44537.1 plastocyanin [Kutzneria buriramensis]